MTIVNLTPHTLNFVFNETKIDIEPSGSIARVSAKDTPMNPINGIPTVKTEYGEIENLPAPEVDTIYVVSSLVAARCPEREDVFIPGRPIRDDQGRIIGSAGLSHV